MDQDNIIDPELADFLLGEAKETVDSTSTPRAPAALTRRNGGGACGCGGMKRLILPAAIAVTVAGGVALLLRK